ncbi:restriction endonuclease subunit S [Lactococcus lactis]|uniref:restriction endonuclease subunit S n=1 Tax=Lactococcus lactis TaxID=1358 RepID=UPI0028925629|nr:restriction endonuclease subunit S [Lactococcus lactis]MDT2858222.1 restriction endonuclease subunit S [Lactococcus lactis]
MAKIDDSVKKKVPKLRFKGFTDDWEERKFDECFNFPVSTNSLSRALLNYDEGDIKSVHYGDILIKYPAILNIKNDKIPYITGGKLEKYKSSLLENGDLIFADAAEDETVGKAVEVNGLTEENLVAGLHTIVARPKDKKAEFFLGYYINSNTYHRQLLRLIQGSKVSSISKGNLQKTLVSFPKDFEEQQKIGAFFKKIDDTIALHQRKLDLLKEQKKGYLQKMFPKNGAKVPELRFAGFADDWEERKLGDYVIIRSGWSPSNFDINNNANNLFIKVDDLNYSTRVQKESQVKVNILSKYKKMKKSSTIFPKRGAAIMTNKVRMLGEDSYMDTNMMALEPKGIDPEYLYTFINKTGLYKIADTSTIPQINNKHIEPYLLLIPSLEEQHKLGSFFKQLDETIALHQRKLDLLKEQKKGFLQQMFV